MISNYEEYLLKQLDKLEYENKVLDKAGMRLTQQLSTRNRQIARNIHRARKAELAVLKRDRYIDYLLSVINHDEREVLSYEDYIEEQ